MNQTVLSGLTFDTLPLSGLCQIKYSRFYIFVCIFHLIHQLWVQSLATHSLTIISLTSNVNQWWIWKWLLDVQAVTLAAMGSNYYMNLFKRLSIISFSILADTTILSTSQPSWLIVMEEKLKGRSLPSTTTCVFLNGCQPIACWKERSRKESISLPALYTWGHLRSPACLGLMSVMWT